MGINRKISGVWLGDSHPVRLMGVLNLGPESFYKGSVVSSEDQAVAKATQMVSEGAEFLDLGAMSTAPGVKDINEEEELSRLIPILKSVLTSVDVPVSVDTFRSDVADKALSLGAAIINDVSGFKFDDRMVKVLAEYDAPSVIMATDEKIGDPLTIKDTIRSLKQSIELAEKHGYDSNNMIIDPAIGRWVPEKTYEYNLNIIKNLNTLSILDKPILIGISRKSFIHEILNRPDPADRLAGTLSSTAIAIYNGAHIVRTHDVAETSDVVHLAKLLRDISDSSTDAAD
jgi:dihydropteroate synthase